MSNIVRNVPIHARSAIDGNRPRLRVLVIDDEVAMGRTLAIGLADEFDVTTVTSGQRALELLDADDSFDAVLCDLMMPDVSGMEVYERVFIRSPTLAARFAFVTGGVYTDRARAFLERVGGPVLEKPFDINKLGPVLRERATLGKS